MKVTISQTHFNAAHRLHWGLKWEQNGRDTHLAWIIIDFSFQGNEPETGIVCRMLMRQRHMRCQF
jgi:hypothetical protein